MGGLAASQETWVRRTFWLLLVAVPLALNPWALDPYAIQTHLLRFLAAAVLLAYALGARGPAGLTLQLTPLTFPLSAAWLITGLATITSRDPLTSLTEFFHLGLLVVLFHVLVARPGVLVPSMAFGVMALAGAVMATYGFAQICGFELLGEEKFYHAASTAGNPNMFAEVLTLVLPGTAALAASASLLARLSAGAAVVLLGLALGATQGRAAMLGLVMGAAVAGAFVLWWQRKRRLALRVRAASLILAGLVLLVILFPIGLPRLYRAAVDRCVPRVEAPVGSVRPATYQKRLAKVSTLAWRVHVWEGTIRLIRNHPVSGVGPGNYVVAFTPEYEPIDQWWLPYDLNYYAHNEPLQYMVETGIAGGLIFLWLAGTVLWMVGRLARRVAEAEQQRLLLVTTAALVAIGVSSLLAFPFHESIQQLYALAHLVLLAKLYQEISPPVGSVRLSAPLASGVSILVVVITGVMGITANVSGMYALRGWQVYERGEWDHVGQLKLLARQWDPLRARRSDLERDLVSKAYARGLAEVERRLTQKPDDAALYRQKAEHLVALNQPRRAAQALGRSLELDPRYAPAHRALAEVLLPLGAYDQAISHLETYLATLPPESCDAKAWANLGSAHFLAGSRDAAERAWAKAIACDAKMAEYRAQFLRRVEGLKPR